MGPEPWAKGVELTVEVVPLDDLDKAAEDSWDEPEMQELIDQVMLLLREHEEVLPP